MRIKRYFYRRHCPVLEQSASQAGNGLSMARGKSTRAVGQWFGVVALVLASSGLVRCVNSTLDDTDSGSSEDEFGGCGFMSYQPRYFQVLSSLTLQNVPGGDILVNDALIRILRRRLMVAECQMVLSEGVPCTSGTQDLPCTDPVHSCAFQGQQGQEQVVLTNDVYDAIVSESCDSNGDGLVDALDGPMRTLVCGEVLDSGTTVQRMVRQGSCTAICDLDAFLGGNYTAGTAADVGSSCLSFELTLNVATEQAATGILGELVSDRVGDDVQMSLSGFGSAPLKFSVVDAAIGDAVGFGFFPPPPPPPPPLKELISPASRDLDPGSKQLVYGDWTPCYPSCGDGVLTRTVTCIDGDGSVLPVADCPGGLLAESSKKCSTACELPYWSYGPWQTCDRRCGTGQSSRSASCVSDGVTECQAGDQEPLARECNTIGCDIFSWVQSEWSECSESCGGGTQLRTVSCVDSGGSDAPDSSCDASTMPATSRVCNSQPCDFCELNVCLGRGTCSDGKCDCDDKYSGTHCEVHASCQSGVVSSNLACCTSGVVDANGECCPEGSSIDGNGACCSGTVDACGVCNGQGKFVDIQGRCCAVVDADGVCCASGLIDECGVCNGVGNTCNILLGLNMRVPADIVVNNTVQPATIDAYLDMVANMTGITPDRITVGEVSLAPTGSVSPPAGRKLLEGAAHRVLLQDPESPFANLIVQVEIAPDVNKPTEIPFSSSYYATLLPEASEKFGSEKFSVDGVPVATRSGVCGNGICEIGERGAEGNSIGTCAEDCGLPSKACPGGCSNGGVCLPASGVCQCPSQYTGPSCAACAEGYSRSSDGNACIVNVAEQGIISGSVLGANGEALVSGSTSGGTSAGVIVGAVFGALIGVLLLVVAAILIRNRCMNRVNKTRLVSNKIYEERPDQSEPDLGLRKKYGLAPYSFGYSDYEISDQIRAGQYHHDNQAFEEGNRCEWSDVDGREDLNGVEAGPEHRAQVSYVTHAVPMTSSDQNSAFQTNLYVKDPSPERFHPKVAPEEHGQYSGEHSGYIKAADVPPQHATIHHEYVDGVSDTHDGDIAHSIGQLTPETECQRKYHADHGDGVVECASLGSASRMVFNPAFSMRTHRGDQEEYPKTVLVNPRGDVPDVNDLDARRQKLDALRAAVRSLESSRAPSRESSFTMNSENIVDIESVTGKPLPTRPDTVPALNLSSTHAGGQSSDQNIRALPGVGGHPKVLHKEPTSFFATVKRALTPPRFRKPDEVDAVDAVDAVEDDALEVTQSVGSFTQVLEAVDSALGVRDTTKKSAFDARHFQ